MLTTFRLPSFLLDAMAAPLLEDLASLPPSQVLNNGIDAYLRRWYIKRSKDEGNVYLHNTLRSDYDQEHHDHPWDNMSICLKGEWTEEVTMPNGEIVTMHHEPGTVISRPATTPHRIVLDSPTWTLFLTGPKIREWGFLHADGWMHNQDFFKMRGYF